MNLKQIAMKKGRVVEVEREKYKIAAFCLFCVKLDCFVCIKNVKFWADVENFSSSFTDNL